MPITYVGGVQSGRAGSTATVAQSLTALTGGSNSAPSTGDLIVVTVFVGTADTYHPTTLAIGGWSALSLHSYIGATNDAFIQTSYLVAGASPPTSVTIPSSGNARNAQRWSVQVFRGCNQSQPVYTVAYANGVQARPNPAPITPVAPGSWILWLGAAAAATGVAFTAPTGYTTNWLGGTTADTYDCMSGAGYYTGWTSGEYDPPAITAGGTVNNLDSYAALTVVIQPTVNLIGNAQGTVVATANATLTTDAAGAELVNSASGTTTVTLASWVEVGDVAVLMAFRDGSATPPSLAAGCTSLDSTGSGTSSSVLAYKVLTAGGAQSIGPFTNATSVACLVYRNAHPTTPLGNWALATGSSSSVTLPAVTAAVDSFVAGFAGHQSVDVLWPYNKSYSAVTGAGALPNATNWQELIYGAGTFLALNNNQTTAATSSNLSSWASVTLPSTTYWGTGIYAEGIFVIASIFGTQAATSPDGTTWTPRTLPTSTDWRGMAYGGGTFVMVAFNTNAATYSLDGFTWSATTLNQSAFWYDVAYGNGIFLAVASGIPGSKSSDGISWTGFNMPADRQWQSITFGDGVFVAIANASTVVAVTADGITWTEYATLPVSQSWTRIEYGNGIFIATASGTSSIAAASSDGGKTWTAFSMPSSSDWRAVAYNPDLDFFGAIINYSSATAKISATAIPVLRRLSNTDATDSIAAYDTAGPAV